MPYADPERHREHDRAYRAANRERIRERKRAHYTANAERIRADARAYRAANIEHIRERRRKHSLGTPEERFWAKIAIGGPDECWEWQGFRNPGGYGRTHFAGRHVLAHRLSWELTNGPIPDGLNVLHTCDNPPCCNPGDLFLGTDGDNNRDKASKGRASRLHGTRNGRARLDENDVRQVRELLAAGVPHREIARRFGVVPGTIDHIAAGTSWAGSPETSA